VDICHPKLMTYLPNQKVDVYDQKPFVCFGSSAEVETPHSLTAASKRKAATQTRVFDLLD
jgi:hypothetical protein